MFKRRYGLGVSAREVFGLLLDVCDPQGEADPYRQQYLPVNNVATSLHKVPDVKQTLLRARSLVSKREFDSMLQLLNSHCAIVRHELETNSASPDIFAPPPYKSRRFTRHESSESHDDRSKRARRDTMTPSDFGSESLDGQPSNQYMSAKKPGRPAGHHRKAHQYDDASDGTPPPPLSDTSPIYTPTTQFSPADWKPPESLSNSTHKAYASSVCPSSEIGDSKRRHTRYSTTDYQDPLLDRIEIWKPDGEQIKEQQLHYRRWEEKMTQHYGPHWEKNISHERPGIPFE